MIISVKRHFPLLLPAAFLALAACPEKSTLPLDIAVGDSSPPVDARRDIAVDQPLAIDLGEDQAAVDLGPADADKLYGWSKLFGGPGNDRSMAVALDSNGNIAITGFFYDTLDLGGGVHTSAGSSDKFVASYTPNGTHRWSKRFGGTGPDWSEAVAADSSGNVTVAGSFSDTTDFGDGPVTSAGSADAFVASYTSTGAHRWSAGFGASFDDGCKAVAVDGSGNVIVTGHFGETIDLGGGPLTSAGSYDIFVASYTSAGAHIWSKRLGGSGADQGHGLAVDTQNGNVVVTGYFSNAVDFGGGTLQSAGDQDIFVAGFTSTGAHRWSKRAGGPGVDWGRSAAIDSQSGNATLIGFFETSADFGGNALQSAGDYDIFVASYDASGTHRWSKGFGGSDRDTGNTVAVESQTGDVTIIGHFRSTLSLGGKSFQSAGNYDILIAGFSQTGAHRWSRRYGGASGSDFGEGVAVDSQNGNVIATGYCGGGVDFGGGPLKGTGAYEVFLVQLLP